MSESQAVAIIGAAGGIGRELAQRLAEQGRPLLLMGRNGPALDDLASSLPTLTTVAAVDALDRAALQGVVTDYAAQQALGGFVNLAGSIYLKPAQRTTPADFQDILNANLVTAFNCVAVSQATMRKGSVVLMSSVAAQVGLLNHEAIAAAKAGVEGLMRAAAASGARKGLRCNAVAPALVDTPMAAGLLASDAARQASNRMHPLGRVGRPEEIAQLICWLLDAQAEWITGQVFAADGGLGGLRLPS